MAVGTGFRASLWEAPAGQETFEGSGPRGTGRFREEPSTGSRQTVPRTTDSQVTLDWLLLVSGLQPPSEHVTSCMARPPEHRPVEQPKLHAPGVVRGRAGIF